MKYIQLFLELILVFVVFGYGHYLAQGSFTKWLCVLMGAVCYAAALNLSGGNNESK